MDKLFIEKELVKQAEFRFLEKDPNTWVKTIVSEFISEYPIMQDQPMKLVWKKKDDAKGFAAGYLDCGKFVIPIVVDDFRFYPFDIMMYNNNAFPLNGPALYEVMTKASPFSKVVAASPKSSLDLFNQGYMQASPIGEVMPTGEASITRDAVKVGSFIDRVTNVDDESVLKIFKYLSKNPDIMEQYEKNGTVEVLEKLGNKTILSKEAEVQEFINGLEIDRQYIFEDEEGNYIVKSANALLDYTWSVEANADETTNVKILLAPKTLTVSDNFEKVSEACSKIPEVGDYGYFNIGEQCSPYVEILDIEKLIPFKKTACFPFLDNSGSLVIIDGQWKILDEVLTKEAGFNNNITASEPNLGDSGVWKICDKTSRPFTIKGMQKVAGLGNYEITADHGFETRTYKLVPMKSDNFISSGNNYEIFVPGNAEFIKLEKKSHVNTSHIKQLLKTASATPNIKFTVLQNLEKKAYYLIDDDKIQDIEIGANKDEIYIHGPAEFYVYTKLASSKNNIDTNFNYVGKDTAGLFYAYGTEFDKYAQYHPLSNLTQDNIIWAAVHCGASTDDITSIQSLHKGEVHKIANILKAPISTKEYINSIESNYDVLTQGITKLNKFLVKEAAVIANSATVDAVLSLSLIKKFNIAEYLNLIPDYERVASELAYLLLMTRLGGLPIQEDSVKLAMQALSSVIITLKQILQLSKSK